MSSIVKKIGIIAVVAVMSTVFWILVKPWLGDPFNYYNWQAWIAPLALLILLSPIIVLALMLFASRWMKLVIASAVAVPFMLVFGFSWLFLTASLILLGLFVISNKYVSAELGQRIKINTSVIMERSLKGIMLALLIMISFAYYSTPGVQESAVSQRLPASVKKIVETSTDVFLGSQLQEVPPNQRAQAKNQVVNQVMVEFTNLARPYFHYFPPVIAFGLFLILEGLSFIFVWLSIWLGQLIFWSLRKSGFVVVEEKEVKAEVLARL